MNLPPLDLYVPFREHRRTWTGTANIVVGALSDNREPSLTAYTTAGYARTYTAGQTVPSEVLILMHPAERKSRRIRPQADRPGDVIQDPDDGDLSGTLVVEDESGKQQVFELASLATFAPANCRVCEDTIPPSPPPPPPSDTTYLDYLQVYMWWDGGWNGYELRFNTTYYANGISSGSSTLHIEGIRKGVVYQVPRILIHRRIREQFSDRINVRVTELDPIWNDDLGNRDFYRTDRGEIRSIRKGDNVTNVRLNWTPK